MNTDAQITSLRFEILTSFPSDIYPQVELLDHKVVVPISFLPTMHKDSLFSTSFPILLPLLITDILTGMVGVISHLDFDVQLLDNYNNYTEQFSYTCRPFI